MSYKKYFCGQLWSEKVGFGQVVFDREKCEKNRGQKKWARGRFCEKKWAENEFLYDKMRGVFNPF